MTGATPPRRYTDSEVRRLLARAAELQDREPFATDQSGLTLGQLELVAREAGIDPGAVRRAAEELDSAPHAPAGAVHAIMGAPLSHVVEHTLPFEVPPEALESLAPLLQAASGDPGQAAVAGTTLTWRSWNRTTTRDFHAMVTSRSGSTRIWIEERYGQLAGGIYGGGLAGVGGGLGLGVGLGAGIPLGSVALAVGFPVLVLGGAYASCRALYRSIVDRRLRALRLLRDELADQLAASVDAG